MDTIYQFVECDTCKATPGSPILCNGCSQNKSTIYSLIKERDSQYEYNIEQISRIAELENLLEESKTNKPCFAGVWRKRVNKLLGKNEDE